MTKSTASVRDPYQSGMITERPRILRARMPLKVVGVLDSRREGRGLELIYPRTRCISRDEIHELIVTTQSAAAGGTVDLVHYLGFFAFEESSVLVEGDRLVIDGETIGEVMGFDATHQPNHYNIVLKTDVLRTGMDIGLKPGSAAMFVPWDEAG